QLAGMRCWLGICEIEKSAKNLDPSTRVSRAGECAREPSLAQDDSVVVVVNMPAIAHFYFLSVSASTPGSFLPSRNSSEAPPPVEMCEIFSATPAACTAATESPPPTMETAPRLLATARAIATVPSAKGSISNTPIGPFQTIVLPAAISVAYR